MIERIDIWGVAASLVAEARVVLPGDESVELPLRIQMTASGPVLALDLEPVRDVLIARQLAGPTPQLPPEDIWSAP